MTSVQRRSQEERSATTRARLLKATVECLVERGYAGTTTTAVAQRAGVSRGAQLHHFGTRERLVGAAVSHLAEQRTALARERAARLAGRPDRLRRTLDLLADLLDGPLYAATVELWVAARSDPALREVLLPVEQQVNAALFGLCLEYVTTDPLLCQLTLDMLAGRGVTGLITPHRPHHRRKVLDAWAEFLRAHTPAAV
jgi:AcrR family transcriptional regulator